jgi:hypothetical protein
VKKVIVNGAPEQIEELKVNTGDIIVTINYGTFLVAQVEAGVLKLINMSSGNRQRDVGTFSRETSLQEVLDKNNLPDSAKLIKLGKYRLELEY